MSDHLAKPPFVVLESRSGEQDRLKLTEGDYSGIIFSYGAVRFDEEGDTCKMHFEYEVHEDAGVTYIKEELEQYLGDLLQFIIMDQLQQNSISYTGGVDEIRTTDSEQTDL
jgi:hypothetical protein